jgi:hypothetical protein
MSAAPANGRFATPTRVRTGQPREPWPSFPKDPSIPGGLPVSSPSGNLPLSPREQEILSLCLQSTEDPRDIGMLVALLSVERRTSGAEEP